MGNATRVVYSPGNNGEHPPFKNITDPILYELLLHFQNCGCCHDSGSSLTAPAPVVTDVTENGFKISWPAVALAETYTINLYSDAGRTALLFTHDIALTEKVYAGRAASTNYYAEVIAKATGLADSDAGYATATTAAHIVMTKKFAFVSIGGVLPETEAEIRSWANRSELDTPAGSTRVTADYRAYSTPVIMGYAEPLTEPEKIQWYGADFNKDLLANPGSFFMPFITMGTLRVSFSAFASTQTDTPINFNSIPQ